MRPPPPPPPPSLTQLLADLSIRQQELQQHYAGGGNPRDMVAQVLRGGVRAQGQLVGQAYANATPQQQQAATPAMQQAEQTRLDIEREEFRLRKQLNEQLKNNVPLFERLSRTLMHGGGIGGMLAALGPGGIAGSALASTIATVFTQALHAEQHRITTGGAALSPSGASTEAQARELANMAEALRQGELQRQQAAAGRSNLRALAQRHGLLNAANDPYNPMNVTAGVAGGAALNRGMEQARNNFLRHWSDVAMGMLRGNTPGQAMTQARQNSAEREREYYANMLREAGVKEEDINRASQLRNRGIPGVQGGITTALGYQEELQVNQLQRNDQQNENLQMVLSHLVDLLTSINDNTNGLESLTPQWSP